MVMQILWKHTVSAAETQQNTAQKMKFSMKDFLSKCDKIRSFHKIPTTGNMVKLRYFMQYTYISFRWKDLIGYF